MSENDISRGICLSIIKEFNEKNISFTEGTISIVQALIYYHMSHKLKKDSFYKLLDTLQEEYDRFLVTIEKQ